MNISLKIKRLRAVGELPAYATDGSAALDLRAAIEAPIEIAPSERRLIPCGIAISIPRDTVAVISARSGLSSKKGLTAANGVGVIDSDYRGEIFYSLINLSNQAQIIEPGERIAQMMLLPVIRAEIEEVDTLDETDRGVGGFGSTGSC